MNTRSETNVCSNTRENPLSYEKNQKKQTLKRYYRSNICYSFCKLETYWFEFNKIF